MEVVLVTLHVSGCYRGYSPCRRAVEQRAFHIGVENSDFDSCLHACEKVLPTNVG